MIKPLRLAVHADAEKKRTPAAGSRESVQAVFGTSGTRALPGLAGCRDLESKLLRCDLEIDFDYVFDADGAASDLHGSDSEVGLLQGDFAGVVGG